MSSAEFNMCEDSGGGGNLSDFIYEAPQSWRESLQFLPNSAHSFVDPDDAESEMGTNSVAADGGSFPYPSSVRKTRPTKRNPTSWTPLEDEFLIRTVRNYGAKNWSLVAEAMSQLSEMRSRNGKQCRERWHNNLDPTLNHKPFTEDEDRQLMVLRRMFDNKWTEISKRMPGRSDNAVKNRWNSTLRRTSPISPSPNLYGINRLAPFHDASFGLSSIANDSLSKDPCNIQVVRTTGSPTLPCAVRSTVSVRRLPSDAVAKTVPSKLVHPDEEVCICFVGHCSSVAQYGFRTASGQVRRTRCFLHHEPGMYVNDSRHRVAVRFFNHHFLGSLTGQWIPQACQKMS